MRSKKSVFVIMIICFFTGPNLYAEDFIFPVSSAAENTGTSIMDHEFTVFNQNTKQIYVNTHILLNRDNFSSNTGNEVATNWHKILGWSTIAAAIVSMGSGMFIPGDVHCGLSYFATGLGAATCINGYYNYGDMLGQNRQYTAHGVMGTISVIGFAAALGLADGEGHKIAGGISAVTFAATVGLLYF